MKKKTTNYLTKYFVIMVVVMAIFVVMDNFVAHATPVRWVVLLATTAWLAYTSEFGGEND